MGGVTVTYILCIQCVLHVVGTPTLCCILKYLKSWTKVHVNHIKRQTKVNIVISFYGYNHQKR